MFRIAKVSSLASDGFLRRKKCAEIPDDESLRHADGGERRDGSGGVREGKVTGMGREGGALSFLQSCWPARRPPAQQFQSAFWSF
jgi:hypothetical protein